MSEPAPTGLAAALAAFQAEIPHVGKNSSATVQGGRQHRYGDLAAISKTALAKLGSHGLSFIAKPTMHPEHGFVLSYALMHTSGEAERGLYPLPGSGSPQTIGSAITYARRYCLCAVTGVAPDDDDDDGAAAEREHRERADGLPANADGSLSRSRTTDAEKDAAGVMTAAQQAGHTALQPKAAEVRGRVTRIQPDLRLTVTDGPGTPESISRQAHAILHGGEPEADPWQDQPAGLLPVGDPEDRPGSILRHQSRSLHAAFTALGIKDRANRLGLVSEIVGREVTSSNELSYTEAGKVLEMLNARAVAK